MSEQKIQQWQMRCADHGPMPFEGKKHTQKYKADNEMWEHRNKGHVHAHVVEAVEC